MDYYIYRNNNYDWRVGAKIVAIIDLIFSVFKLILSLALIFFAGLVTEAVVDSDTKPPEGAAAVAWFMWVIVVIAASVTLLGLWAAVQLLKATELGRDALEAYRLCQPWFILAIVSIVLDLTQNLMMSAYVLTVISFLVRGSFLYVVYQYKKELQSVAIGFPNNGQPIQRI